MYRFIRFYGFLIFLTQFRFSSLCFFFFRNLFCICSCSLCWVWLSIKSMHRNVYMCMIQHFVSWIFALEIVNNPCIVTNGFPNTPFVYICCTRCVFHYNFLQKNNCSFFKSFLKELIKANGYFLKTNRIKIVHKWL